MTEQDSDHKQTIREAFTRQVETYSASERIANPEGRRAFVEFVDPPREASVLDIATGPGFMAFAFAERVRDVVGVDVTPAMLARAEAERARLGLINVRFQEGDAEALPFTDGSFDIVTCGSAFHHFLHPERILAEMVRVLRRGGTVAISDITTNEDALKAERHNRIENLRDPSHTRCLPISELVSLGARCGLSSPRTQISQRERWLQEWVGISRTPAETAGAVCRLLMDTMEGDSAGIGVWMEGDEPHFWHTCVSYVATKAFP